MPNPATVPTTAAMRIALAETRARRRAVIRAAFGAATAPLFTAVAMRWVRDRSPLGAPNAAEAAFVLAATCAALAGVFAPPRNAVRGPFGAVLRGAAIGALSFTVAVALPISVAAGICVVPILCLSVLTLAASLSTLDLGGLVYLLYVVGGLVLCAAAILPAVGGCSALTHATRPSPLGDGLAGRTSFVLRALEYVVAAATVVGAGFLARAAVGAPAAVDPLWFSAVAVCVALYGLRRAEGSLRSVAW